MGIVVTDFITTSAETDIYATHKASLGQGGYRSVQTTADMELIPAERREEGMAVFVVGEQKTYKLIGGIDNTKWVADGGSTPDFSTIPVTNLEMTDYFVIIRNGNTYKAKVEDLRCKLINEYIVTNYPENAVFVGECPIFVEDELIKA